MCYHTCSGQRVKKLQMRAVQGEKVGRWGSTACLLSRKGSEPHRQEHSPSQPICPSPDPATHQITNSQGQPAHPSAPQLPLRSGRNKHPPPRAVQGLDGSSLWTAPGTQKRSVSVCCCYYQHYSQAHLTLPRPWASSTHSGTRFWKCSGQAAGSRTAGKGL